MIRFDRRPPPIQPVSAGMLLRVAVLSGLCLLTLVGVLVIERPGLWGQGGGATEPTNDTALQTALRPTPFDQLGEDVIVSDGQIEPPEQPRSDETPVATRREDGTLEPDRELLEGVLDKTPGLPARQTYHLLAIAAQTPLERLDAHARRDVTFRDVWHKPERHRGELIHLQGHLRGLKKHDTLRDEFTNPTSIPTLFEGYLFTDEAGDNPYVVLMPSVAEGMPLGTDILESVTFAGYFLKLVRYPAAGGIERAGPVLVGRLITWTPAPPRDDPSRLGTYLAVAFVVLLVGVGGAVRLLNRRAVAQAAGMNGAVSAAADAADPATVAARLAELEKRDRDASASER